MREPTPRGPAIDLSEFERRLRGKEPAAAKPSADPLSELARLMQGENAQEAPPPPDDPFARTPVRERTGPAPTAPAWRARPPAPRPGVEEDPFAAELRGSFGPDAPHVAPQQPSYREPAPPPPDYSRQGYREPAYLNPAQPTSDYYGGTYQPRADYDAEPAQYPAEGEGYGAAPAPRYEGDAGYAEDQAAYPPGQEGYYEGAAGYDQDSRYGYEAAETGWDDGSREYLDYGQRAEGDDDGYDGRKGRGGGFLSRLPTLRPWHAVAGVAVLGLISIGWGFAHRGGGAGLREVPTINAPEGPSKAPPDAEAQQQNASPQGATVLERREPAPVKQVVTNEEQPVDPKVAPRAVQLGDGPADAPHEPAGAAPRRVKTISVRPDGTVIENDAPPPAVTTQAEGGAGQAEAARGVTPKSAAKPATTPAASQAKPKQPKTVAAVDSAAAPEAAAPAPDSGGRGYAVQFGAANSEAEARGLLTKVAKQYASALGGRRPTFKPAKVDGKTVYRVRVAGVSKDAATAICEKVKSSGGNCFVAGN